MLLSRTAFADTCRRQIWPAILARADQVPPSTYGGCIVESNFLIPNTLQTVCLTRITTKQEVPFSSESPAWTVLTSHPNVTGEPSVCCPQSLAVQEARRMGGPVGAALEHAAHKEALRSTVAASLHGRGRAAALEQQEGPRPSHWGGLLGWATAGRAAGFKVWRHGSDHDADVIGSGGGGSSDGGGMGTSDDFDCSKVGKCAVAVAA